MNNRDFCIAVNKFFYYSQNYKSDGNIPEFFDAFESYEVAHFVEKWNMAYKHSGCKGAMIDFYAELDSEHRGKLLRWINENYKMSEGFGIDL